MKDKEHNVRAGSRIMKLMLAACTLSSMASSIALAQAAPDFGGADSKVTGFLQSINGLLNMASIAVVTIAVIFAGYQIAFAHKRIADVAPILIGGFLIGAAAQIAKMLVGDPGGAVAVMTQALPSLYA